MNRPAKRERVGFFTVPSPQALNALTVYNPVIEMNLEDFIKTVEADDDPPESLPEPTAALWHDRKGEWDRAHEIVQDLQGADAAWVHAYLHRKEGDLGNARYWYRRAGKPEFTGSLDSEWRQIVSALLGEA